VLFLCSDWRSCFEIRGPRFENQAGKLLNWPALIVVFSSPFIQYTAVHHDRLLNQNLTTLPWRRPSPPKEKSIINKVAPTGRLYCNSHEEWTNIASRYESGEAGYVPKGGRPRAGRAQSRRSHECTSQCICTFHSKTFVRINLPMVAMVTALPYWRWVRSHLTSSRVQHIDNAECKKLQKVLGKTNLSVGPGKLLLVLATTVILGSESRATHDRMLLSQKSTDLNCLLSNTYDRDHTENTKSTSYFVFAFVFVAAENCLPNRCLGMVVSSSSIIPVFRRWRGDRDTQTARWTHKPRFFFFQNKESRLKTTNLNSLKRRHVGIRFHDNSFS
jgi:hypothetical protein